VDDIGVFSMFVIRCDADEEDPWKVLSIVRSVIVVAKLAKSFGGAAIPKVSATFATVKSDSHFSNGAKSLSENRLGKLALPSRHRFSDRL
jgi:hypothetical protein